LERRLVLAKQVLSQLSYTPTVGVTFILEHFRGIRNPFLRFSVITVPKLYQNPWVRGCLHRRLWIFSFVWSTKLALVAGRKRNTDQTSPKATMATARQPVPLMASHTALRLRSLAIPDVFV